MSEQLFITMRVPVSPGQFLTIIFDASQSVDFAPLYKWSGARVAHGTAPLHLKPLKESGAGAPLLHSAPLPSQEWRSPSPQGEFLGPKKKNEKPAEIEIAETRNVVADLASDMADIDRELYPAREQERSLKDDILATHNFRSHPKGRVVVFNPAGARRRAPLFLQLDAISHEWGPLKNKRRALATEIKILEREIERLLKVAVKPRKQAEARQWQN